MMALKNKLHFSNKSLGTCVDENLSWIVHVDKISQKIAFGTGVLRRSGSFVPFETLLCMYYPAVVSIEKGSAALN